MPWPTEHKLKSKDKILVSAARLFTRHGFDGVSIDDVMTDANLTRGAFYAHFSSKAQLYNQAITSGAKYAKQAVEERVTNLEEFVWYYLNIGTQNSIEYCTLAFLVTDICHRDETVKATYSKTLKGYQALLRSFGLTEEQSVQASILLIGGLALSRAVSDEGTKQEILKNACSAVLALANIT